MIVNFMKLELSSFFSGISTREKIIGLFFVLFLNVLFPSSDLCANDLPSVLWKNDSEGTIYSPRPTMITDHKFYGDTLLTGITVENLAIPPAPSKQRSLFSIVNQRSVFTDIQGIQKSAISTHIISPTKSFKNDMRMSAIHSCTTINSARHDSLGGLINYKTSNFVLGAKYMLPFSFGEFYSDSQTKEEDAWGVSLKYQVTDPLYFDIHYEKSNSDIFTKNISSNKQYGLAATYTFSLRTESDCNVTSGYRKIENETSGYNDNQADLDEFLIQLNLGF